MCVALLCDSAPAGALPTGRAKRGQTVTQSLTQSHCLSLSVPNIKRLEAPQAPRVAERQRGQASNRTAVCPSLFSVAPARARRVPSPRRGRGRVSDAQRAIWTPSHSSWGLMSHTNVDAMPCLQIDDVTLAVFHAFKRFRGVCKLATHPDAHPDHIDSPSVPSQCSCSALPYYY